MDFVAKEIFYLFWFSSMLGAFGKITEEFPVNQAVLNGEADVKITCVSNTNANAIKWSFRPVGSSEDKPISIPGDAYSGLAGDDGKSYTLTIKIADASTAGTYTCDEGGKKSALLIVVTSAPACDFSPRDTTKVSCESNLTLSCTVSYTTNTTLAVHTLDWSAVPPADSVLHSTEEPLSTSENIATATSTLVVTWPKDKGNMPNYTCTTTFNVRMSRILPSDLVRSVPTYSGTCQPFSAASSVPCIDKDGKLRKYEDTKKSEEDSSAVRSAETNNLAIRVLSVAGVLLLAQVL